MAHKYFPDQFDDEEVLFVFKKHPIVMRKGIIFASLAMLLPVMVIFGLTFTPNVPSMNSFYLSLAIGVLLAVLVMFPSWISWYFTIFVVTDQRFIQIGQQGLWNRSVVDIGIDKISTVSYQIKGVEESLLGFGTIVIQTYVGELVIHHVHHPRSIQKRLTHTLRELGISSSPAMANNQVNEA